MGQDDSGMGTSPSGRVSWDDHRELRAEPDAGPGTQPHLSGIWVTEVTRDPEHGKLSPVTNGSGPQIQMTGFLPENCQSPMAVKEKR